LLLGKSTAEAGEVRQIPILMQYWRIVIRWKWIIAVIVAAFLVAGLVVTLLMTPQYTSTVALEISRQRDKVVNVQGVEPEVSDVDAEFYQTQYSLLRARSLAQRVVSDLKLAESNDFFEAFRVNPDHAGLFSRADPRLMTAAQRANRIKVATDVLLDHLSIAPVRGSSLVNVSFTSPKRDLSQKIASAWASAYIASNLSRRFEASAYARSFLEGRLEQLRDRLAESERRVVQYAANEKIVSIPNTGEGGGERTLVGDDLARLNGELASAVGDRVKAESRLGDKPSSSTEALTNPAIASMRQKRAEVASEYANMLVKFEPEYPAAKALASQLSDLDRSIAREEGRIGSSVKLNYDQAMRRERELATQIDQLKGQAIDLRRRSIQYNIYQRDADTNRQLYEGLLQRYKEIGVAGGVGTNNILVVDPASSPDKPSSPSLPLNLAIALLLGAAVAGATVFALEQVDEAIKDPSDIGRSLNMPNLGTIPAIDSSEDPKVILADRKSSLAEAYLSVQTNLRFSTDHGIPRSIAITSTRAAEGKSTTSYALAVTLGRIGRSVVLVDGDMRSPSVHQLLDISNSRGFSNFLSGEEQVGDLIVKLPDLGIDAIPAGPQPPNAAELLNSTRLHTLIAKLLETYDHVIVDSPPVLGLADAPLIGSQVEGVVYAVEANGARSTMIQTAIGRLRNANINMFGIVLTKFRAKQAHFGYGYDYGYGYGQADQQS
jgi:capsular exopolysaccharide synthesis family protein